MTPAARIQAAIEILNDVLGEPLRFDDYFRTWARQHRYAGSKDRAAIKDMVFHIFRHFGEVAWRLPKADSRSLVAGYLVWCDGKSATDMDEIFGAAKYGPAPLTAAEKDLLFTDVTETPPVWAALNVPEWLLPQLIRQFGDELSEELEAMNGRAPLYVRANRLKTTASNLRVTLGQSQIPAEAGHGLPDALAVPPDTRVQDLDAFKQGDFEIQDLGSQIAGDLCDASPGATVVDLAAGAGGKTLQLAAAMSDRGHLIACDIDRERLDRLEKRAKRAGVTCVETVCLDSTGRNDLLTRMKAAADLVLIDAPCSGTGTWRRRPEARWWLTPDHLDRFTQAQQDLLDLGAQLVKPGGRLVYVTCSILPRENQDQMRAFETAHPDFVPVESVTTNVPSVDLDNMHQGVQLTPRRHNTDGFFIKILNRLDGAS